MPPFLSFLVYALIIAALVCAHFLLAYRSWRMSREEQPSEIDFGYIRTDSYFAQSFRYKVADWLKLPVQLATPDGTTLIPKENEKIRASTSADYPPQSRNAEILVVRGNFRCRAGCVFQREIYAQRHAIVGAGTQLQAIACEGDLTIDRMVRIARWADCRGIMTVGENSVVRSRATAGGMIRLQEGAQVQSASAPIVCSLPEKPLQENLVEDPPYRLEIPLNKVEPDVRRKAVNFGIDPRRLAMLTPDCWQYHGDLKPAAPLHVKTKLIVRGNFLIPPRSVLEEDVKAQRGIEVGAFSICRGNVVAEGSIRLEGSSRFWGIVHSGQNLTMLAGVRGGDEEHKVVAFAAETVTIEDNVTVHGKLASGDRMIVVRSGKTRATTAAARNVAPCEIPGANEYERHFEGWTVVLDKENPKYSGYSGNQW